MKTAIVLMLVALPAVADVQEITLTEYLDTLRQNHPFFVKEALSRDIEEQQQRGLAGGEDWVIRAGPSYLHEERSQGSPFSAKEKNQFTVGVGMERQFWSSGSSVSLDYDYYRVKQRFAQPIGTFNEYGNGLSLTYSMPLMKNRGGILSRLSLELQSYNIDLSDVVSKENQEGFLEQNGQLFLRWVFVHEQRRIAESRLHLAEEELVRTKKKRRTRIAAEVDVLRTKDAVINGKQNLQQLVSQWRAIQAELALQSGDMSLYQAKPSFDLFGVEEIPTIEVATEMLQNNSRLLKSVDLQLERLSHQQQALKNELKPELDLVLSGGLRSEDARFNDATKFDQPQYRVGLNFRYPLGQRSAKANESKARLQKNQLRQQRASLGRQLEAELGNVVVQLHELEEVMRLNRQQIEVARQKTQEELKRHNQGRSELTFVIQSRDSEQNAQLNYANNAANYQALWLRYRSLNDSLLSAVAE